MLNCPVALDLRAAIDWSQLRLGIISDPPRHSLECLGGPQSNSGRPEPQHSKEVKTTFLPLRILFELVALRFGAEPIEVITPIPHHVGF